MSDAEHSLFCRFWFPTWTYRTGAVGSSTSTTGRAVTLLFDGWLTSIMKYYVESLVSNQFIRPIPCQLYVRVHETWIRK